MRLGFAVKVLGRPGLKSHDSRRHRNNPHLSVSLVYVRDILLYLARHRIRLYRLSSELAPYAAHPAMPRFHHQVEECRRELAAIGRMAREQGVRLTFHPGAHVNLSSPDQDLVRRSVRLLTVLADILDGMGMGPEGVIVLHVGGAYGNPPSALERFVRRWEALPPQVKARIAVENDDTVFAVRDVLWIHERTGVPVVFDYLHHLNNPDGQGIVEALKRCLATWPEGVRPKIHFSSPRTAMKLVEGPSKKRARPPRTDEHADFVNPFEFIAFCREARNAGAPDFDVMLEAKARDIALLRLREHLRRFAPELLDVMDGEDDDGRTG